MIAEFQWWLLIVGLVIGGGLTATVLFDGARRDEDIAESELPSEAAWIAERSAADGRHIDLDAIETVLRAHRAYRGLPAPDVIPAIGSASVPEDLRVG